LESLKPYSGIDTQKMSALPGCKGLIFLITTVSSKEIYFYINQTHKNKVKKKGLNMNAEFALLRALKLQLETARRDVN